MGKGLSWQGKRLSERPGRGRAQAEEAEPTGTNWVGGGGGTRDGLPADALD